MNHLESTARSLVAAGKGILAADESTGTITRRFDSVGVESTEEHRRDYRELLFTTPGVDEFISGVILFDETIRQTTSDGTPFPALLLEAGILPGIKVDKGAKALAFAPGETVTEGLDGLRERFDEYRSLGARFAKWRAVYSIGAGLPSTNGLSANAHALARYAALAQEAGLVPIVEPEVLMDGDHTITESATVDRPGAAVGLRGARSPGRRSARDAAEAEHGALRLRRRRARVRGRGRRTNPRRPVPPRAGGCARNRVPVGRTERRGRHAAPERDERARRPSLAAFVLVRPRASVGGSQGLG